MSGQSAEVRLTSLTTLAYPTASPQPDCGECTNCLDKPKFGGAYTKRQACKRKLEQLRALYHGEAIHVADACRPVPGGVDTREDLERLRAHWTKGRAE